MKFLLALALGALVLVGCGGGSEPVATPENPSPQGGAPKSSPGPVESADKTPDITEPRAVAEPAKAGQSAAGTWIPDIPKDTPKGLTAEQLKQAIDGLKSMSIALNPGGQFVMSTMGGSSVGKWSQSGQKVTLEVATIDGKPAPDEMKSNKLVLLASADGKKLTVQLPPSAPAGTPTLTLHRK